MYPNSAPNKIESHMALFYDLTFRGTIRSLNWAVVTHWRAVDPDVSLSELQLCQTLCAMGAQFWDDKVQAFTTSATSLTKLVAIAYDEPTGFAELAVSLTGGLGDQICPEFTAKGFRQYRSNSDFRASTHRFPEVREDNNNGGSWVYDVNVNAGNMADIAEFLGEPQTYPTPIALVDATFQPVLLRRQFTTYAEPGHVPLVTVLDPPQISDVASAAFYGITSQVSRKFIIGA